jgi:tight adherence protein C
MSTALAGALLALGGASVLDALGRRGQLALRAGRRRAAPGQSPPGPVSRGRLDRGARALEGWRERTRARLELAGEGKTLRRFLADKLLAAAALPAIPLLPAAALSGRPPSLLLAAPLALAGFFVPDLSLRRALSRRRERILLDLPEALAMLSLALAAGRSLHQALALAARETGGPLGADLATALSLARRDGSLGERAALVRVARASGEPSFARFAELLAAKESPYLDFLRHQAAQARAEQQRLLERAADRAYLAMHAPLAPLLTTLVLLVSYGFLHLLDQSI